MARKPWEQWDPVTGINPPYTQRKPPGLHDCGELKPCQACKDWARNNLPPPDPGDPERRRLAAIARAKVDGTYRDVEQEQRDRNAAREQWERERSR